MKLLLDQCVPYRLGIWIANHGIENLHVEQLGMATASDTAVWSFAKEKGYYLVSKDKDFEELVIRKGAPPKLVWLHTGNTSTGQLIGVMEKHWPDILHFLEESEASILEIQS